MIAHSTTDRETGKHSEVTKVGKANWKHKIEEHQKENRQHRNQQHKRERWQERRGSQLLGEIRGLIEKSLKLGCFK
jgi:hypothetical protein